MTILFPTDFSKAAEHAFVYALKLADKLNASITTVHVYQLPVMRGVHLPNTMKSVYDSITFETFDNYRDSIPYLRELAEQNNMGHIHCDHALVQASKHGVVRAIVTTADTRNADFIVMGTTGASGLKEAFLGSVAAEVLENSNCPVLAVPDKAEFDGKLDRIAFATGYQEQDKSTLETTIRFANLFDATVFCVHVDIAHTEQITHGMDRFMADVKSKENVVVEVLDGLNIEESLAEFIDRNQIDILAMRIKKRSFIQELFSYSMTKKMTNHLRVPVLGLHK